MPECTSLTITADTVNITINCAQGPPDPKPPTPGPDNTYRMPKWDDAVGTVIYKAGDESVAMAWDTDDYVIVRDGIVTDQVGS